MNINRNKIKSLTQLLDPFFDDRKINTVKFKNFNQSQENSFCILFSKEQENIFYSLSIVNFHSRRSNMNEIEVYSIKEIKDKLHISKATILGLVKQNKIPHFFIGKKTLRFRKGAIIQWIDNLEKGKGIA
jgi:excisionase family DNA binding protein